MTRSAHTVHIADPLWQALEQMSRQMAVEPEALVNQAIFTLARLNGFVVPKVVAVEDPRPAPPLREVVPLPVAVSPSNVETAAPASAPDSSIAALRAKAAERILDIVQDVDAFVEPQPDPAPEQAAQGEGSDDADEKAEDEQEQEEDVPEPNTSEEEVPEDSATPDRLVIQPVLQKPPVALQKANPFGDQRTIVQPARPRLFLQLREAEPIEVVAERFLIGRGNHCNLVIDSVRVSREHAVLTSENGGFVLEDLGSSNGTWLGTRRLERHVITDGDVLLLGNEKVRFSVQAPGAPRAA
ncbi:MAG TPA: FHA domain-containing protein [Myxococcaceae bacterium]|nr:FHA domain-containing protein [Myxococcaceae bacterium]